MAIKQHKTNLIKEALRKVDSILPRPSKVSISVPINEEEERIAEAKAHGQREDTLFKMCRNLNEIYGKFPESPQYLNFREENPRYK